MSKKEKIIIIITTVVCVLALISISTFFIYKSIKNKKAKKPQTTLDMAQFAGYEEDLFGFVRPEGAYGVMKDANVHWSRPYPGPFIWGQIEKQKGQYDFGETDNYVKKAQENGVVLLATIWPYAEWDQSVCHEKLDPKIVKDFPQLGEYRQNPCDMEAYKNFIKQMVERYDGDSVNDMPDLKYPVKYWELNNQPDIDWDNRPEGYIAVLKATYESLKSADNDSKVLNGGISSLTDQNLLFWKKVLGEGGAYIDIVAMNAPQDLNLQPLLSFMKDIKNEKPIWLTSIQFGTANNSASEKGISEEKWSEYLLESYIQALGSGVKKLFYFGVDNNSPSAQTALVVNCKKNNESAGSGSTSATDSNGCPKQKMFDAYKTMVKKLDNFDRIEQIAEGQYRFYHGDKSTYVVWKGRIPNSLVENVRLTDVLGNEYIRNASDLTDFNAPLYVEDIEN